MPSRIVREGLLDSGRYWSASIEARQTFLHLMLLADDFGCVSLASAFIRRRCFDDSPSQDKIDRLIMELHDADLIRVYESNSTRYAFIPRFQQRLKRMTLKYPQPPDALVQDDADARKKFSKINQPSEDPAAIGPPAGGQRAAEVEVEVEVEVKRKSTGENRSFRCRKDAARFARWYAAYPLKVAKGQAEKIWASLRPDDNLTARMIQAVEQQVEDRKRLAAEKRFVAEWKHPATWLNAKAWEDESVVLVSNVVDDGRCHCGALGAGTVNGQWRCKKHQEAA